MPLPPPHRRHAPMPRALLALVAVIALIEVALSLADAGVLFDPSLRSRAFMTPSLNAARAAISNANTLESTS